MVPKDRRPTTSCPATKPMPTTAPTTATTAAGASEAPATSAERVPATTALNTVRKMLVLAMTWLNVRRGQPMR